MKKEVGYVIKKLRKEQQFKQQYVAFKLGITVEAYANIENGRADINTNKLKMISLILGTKASIILALAETVSIIFITRIVLLITTKTLIYS